MRIRITKRTVLTGVTILGLVICWFVLKSYTDAILAPHAVAKLQAIAVNGDRQWLLERGCDRRKPVLLFLHGGPGMPAMFTAHVFARALERDFVVVQWDMRGAGKSYHGDLDPKTMTFTQMESDALAVVRDLRTRYHVSRVFLVGHSWGSFLGAHLAADHPELFYVFVGVGMDADHPDERAVQDERIRQRLAELGEKPEAVTAANREDLLFKTGGELANATSMWPLIAAGLLAPEYSLMDAMDVSKGPRFTQKHLVYDIPGGYGAAPERFAIPVAVVMGRGDIVTPISLAKAWYGRLKAPKKVWYEMAKVSHFPHFEDPAAFADVMRAVKRSAGVKDGDESIWAIPVPRFGLQCL